MAEPCPPKAGVLKERSKNKENKSEVKIRKEPFGGCREESI
jgi:hypothetical protein